MNFNGEIIAVRRLTDDEVSVITGKSYDALAEMSNTLPLAYFENDGGHVPDAMAEFCRPVKLTINGKEETYSMYVSRDLGYYYWGSDDTDMDEFIEAITAAGYSYRDNGQEEWIPVAKIEDVIANHFGDIDIPSGMTPILYASW